MRISDWSSDVCSSDLLDSVPWYGPYIGSGPNTMEAEMANMANQPAGPKKAVLYRMVMPDHVCSYGLKAKHLLTHAGYEVEEQHLAWREAPDAFKDDHAIRTTPPDFHGAQRARTETANGKERGWRE